MSLKRFTIENGATIGKYRIKWKLGEGGMSSVYLAEESANSRLVALKFLEKEKLLAEDNIEIRRNLKKRFIREAQTAKQINHPNIILLYESDFDTANWFMAMEYVDGPSLRQLLNDKKEFSPDEIVNILYQMVIALQHAWENYKIIHRDINPQNVMLTKNDVLKIVDLGLAKNMSTSDFQQSTPKLTMPGTPVGTPYYMSPEQAVGQTDIDHRADIYAMGVTLYELCSGERAFPGKTTFTVHRKKMAKNYIPIVDIRSDIPNLLTDLFDKMLEPEPADRIGSYDSIIDILQEICEFS